MTYLKHKPGSIEEIAAKMNPEDSDYQAKFKKELEKAGKGIGAMTPKEKKDFFNKIDKMHKAKNEMTAAQKKLPPALQKAIKDKEDKKEEEMMPKKDMMKKKDEDSHTPADKMKNMINMKKKGIQEMMPKSDFDMKMKKKEELSDKQKKRDMNKNGKIDGEDLAKLRAKKEEIEREIAELESKLEE